MPRGGKRPGAGRKPGQKPKGDTSEAPLFIPKKGRPSAYDPAFCDELVEFCAQGFSITAYAGSIGVSRRTITDWAVAHDEFSLAVQSAKAASAFWWEQRSRRVAEKGGGPGTATMIMFNLKNVAPDDYREKVALEHTGKDGKDLPAAPASVTIFQLPDNGRS